MKRRQRRGVETRARQRGTDLLAAVDAASALAQGGNAGDGEALLHRVLQVDPGHAPALNMLGVIAHQAGDYDRAIDWFSRAIAANRGSAMHHSNLAEALAAAGRSEEAAAQYRVALDLDDGFAAAHNGLGLLLHASGDTAGALDHFRRAVSLDPSLAAAQLNLGITLSGSGEWREAATALQAAVDAGLTLAQDWHERAIRELDRASEAAPGEGTRAA